MDYLTWSLRLFLSLSLFQLTSICSSQANEYAYAKYSVNINGTVIDVFAYHPTECKSSGILVVFHGLNRKAKQLRNKSVPIARQACLTVFAPRFDKKMFPNWRYHRAGVIRSGKVQPRKNWTGRVLDDLLKQLRKIADDRTSPLFLFGHSAGGQFLSRVSAYSPPSSVKGIVIANPSMHVMPDLDTIVPVGFAGLFSEIEARQRLKTYLALPITIYLGQNDIRKKHLVTNAQAMQQGENRLERGRYIFYLGQREAKKRGWEFNWKLIEVPGVGHSSKGMLRANELLSALELTDSRIPMESSDYDSNARMRIK
jgi:pimeloyl-ACP methyl ester carboxylesterase